MLVQFGKVVHRRFGTGGNAKGIACWIHRSLLVHSLKASCLLFDDSGSTAPVHLSIRSLGHLRGQRLQASFQLQQAGRRGQAQAQPMGGIMTHRERPGLRRLLAQRRRPGSLGRLFLLLTTPLKGARISDAKNQTKVPLRRKADDPNVDREPQQQVAFAQSQGR
jgi:hypothetical protein